MKTIWKWELEPDCSLAMPDKAVILAVQAQHNIPCLWALVNPNNLLVNRHFKIYGTGHTIPQYPGIYVGTYQVDHGTLVFHVFEYFMYSRRA